jgi:hypothetical protein
MSNDPLPLDQASFRGSDSNSLLRTYDLAKEIISKSRSQLERDKADKAIRRIAAELQKRNVLP